MSYKPAFALLTQTEVGKRLGLSKARVSELERIALRKLARHPVIRQLAEECGILQESEEDDGR